MADRGPAGGASGTSVQGAAEQDSAAGLVPSPETRRETPVPASAVREAKSTSVGVASTVESTIVSETSTKALGTSVKLKETKDGTETPNKEGTKTEKYSGSKEGKSGNSESSIDELSRFISGLSLDGSSSSIESETGFSWDPKCLKHRANYDHFEKPERVTGMLKELKESGLYSRVKVVKGRLASNAELCSEDGGYGPHTREHVKIVDASKDHKYGPPKRSERDPDDETLYNDCYYLDNDYDTYVNGHSSDAARAAVGCVLSLEEQILTGEIRNGFAAVRPPGHHAGCHRHSGFSLYNNVAIAAKHALNKYPEICKKILIVDWDVHHGDGTQEVFLEDPNILFISIHRHERGKFYPGTGKAKEVGKGKGEGYTVNVPLRTAGLGDLHYARVFNEIVIPIAKSFKPDLVLVSAGFDCALGDPIGGMEVTPKGFGQFTRMLMSSAIQSEGRVLIMLEGGYNVRSVAKSAASCIRALLGDRPGKVEKDEEASKASKARKTHIETMFEETIRTVLHVQSKYWPVKCQVRRSGRNRK